MIHLYIFNEIELNSILSYLLKKDCDHGSNFGGSGKVVGLKGLAESKDRPSTTYALRKYIPHFGSVVGIGPSTKSLRKRPE